MNTDLSTLSVISVLDFLASGSSSTEPAAAVPEPDATGSALEPAGSSTAVDLEGMADCWVGAALALPDAPASLFLFFCYRNKSK